MMATATAAIIPLPSSSTTSRTAAATKRKNHKRRRMSKSAVAEKCKQEEQDEEITAATVPVLGLFDWDLRQTPYSPIASSSSFCYESENDDTIHHNDNVNTTHDSTRKMSLSSDGSARTTTPSSNPSTSLALGSADLFCNTWLKTLADGHLVKPCEHNEDTDDNDENKCYYAVTKNEGISKELEETILLLSQDNNGNSDSTCSQGPSQQSQDQNTVSVKYQVESPSNSLHTTISSPTNNFLLNNCFISTQPAFFNYNNNNSSCAIVQAQHNAGHVNNHHKNHLENHSGNVAPFLELQFPNASYTTATAQQLFPTPLQQCQHANRSSPPLPICSSTVSPLSTNSFYPHQNNFHNGNLFAAATNFLPQSTPAACSVEQQQTNTAFLCSQLISAATSLGLASPTTTAGGISVITNGNNGNCNNNYLNASPTSSCSSSAFSVPVPIPSSSSIPTASTTTLGSSSPVTQFLVREARSMNWEHLESLKMWYSKPFKFKWSISIAESIANDKTLSDSLTVELLRMSDNSIVEDGIDLQLVKQEVTFGSTVFIYNAHFTTCSYFHDRAGFCVQVVAYKDELNEDGSTKSKKRIVLYTSPQRQIYSRKARTKKRPRGTQQQQDLKHEQ